MNNELLSVSMAENGYVLKVCGREKGEPAPKKDKSGYTPWKDTEVYVANTLGDVLKFIDTKLPNLIPYDAEEEYSKSFEKATKDDD